MNNNPVAHARRQKAVWFSLAGVVVVAVVLAVVLSLTVGATGSTQSAPPPDDAAPAAAAPTTTEESAPATNVQGGIGEPLTFSVDDKLAATLTVTKIDPDLQCTAEYAEPAQNGSFLGLQITVQTEKDADPSDISDVVNPYDFQIVQPGGMAVSNSYSVSSSSCLNESEQLPQNFQPGSKYSGMIVLDTPVQHGTVVLRQSGSKNGAEFKF